MKTRILLALIGCLLLATQAVAASPATGNLEVSVTVDGGCLVSADALNFGTYIMDSTSNLDVQSTIRVNCSDLLPYSIDLNNGAHPRGGNPNLYTNGLTRNLDYHLYTDSSHATEWTDTTVAGAIVSSTGTGSEQTFPVYGRIASGQSAPAGSYSDTVTVTVAW